jgi:DNA-binding response OmpR family regulator
VRAEYAGAAGYAGFIAKPFVLEDLLAEVAACLRGRPAERQCGW